MEWLEFSLIALLAYVKTDTFRRISCKADSELDRRERIVSWVVSAIPAVTELVLVVPMALFGSVLGVAMANQAIHGTYIEMVAGLILTFPLYFAFALNAVTIAVSFVLLAFMRTARSWQRLFAAYCAVTAIEYLFIVLSMVLVDQLQKPHG